MVRRMLVRGAVPLLLVARVLSAQAVAPPLQLADAGPRFLALASVGAGGIKRSEGTWEDVRNPAALQPDAVATKRGERTWEDVRNAAVFQQVISIDFRRTPLRTALATIAEQAGLHLTVTSATAGADKLVSLSSSEITVGAALTAVLYGMNADVVLSPGGQAAVVPKAITAALPSRRSQQGAGTITGHVTDAVFKAPLFDIAIRIEGTTRGATAGADGKYTITGVAPGTYRVTARRVGYVPLTKNVTVVADQQATLDFALAAAPTRLDEVVTTAVGEQRRYQIGNDIASINVDSIAPTAPVTSLTDVISARAPGVEVLESNGEVGNGPSLRVRGQGSLVLQGDPIIIVDGVRQDNTPGGGVAPLFGYGVGGGAIPAPSRLNDIDFSDVQSIDILKGPSAATEYGTDAANGVVVITTKHSQAGSPRWRLSAEQSASHVGTSFPETYYAYGHTTGPSPRPTQCPVVPNSDNVGLGWTVGTCAVDSIVKFNALDNPNTTIFGTGSREKFDAAVAGGSDAVRYYVAGMVTNETGPLQVPPAFHQLASSVGLPKADWRPNTDDQRSARANAVIKIAPTADLQVNAAYMATNQQAPGSPSLYRNAYTSLPVDAAAEYFGYGQSYATPVAEYTQLVGQNTNRLSSGLSATWNPTSWFSGHATAGIDHGSQRATAEFLPQFAVLVPGALAELGITNGTTDIYSFDIRGAATANLARDLRAITSLGVQLADTRTQAVYAQSNEITSTNPTLNGAASPVVTQTGARQATLGGYVEEQLGMWDRLFLTGAVRIDAGSNFGTAYNSAVYPKASVSWLVLDQGATTARLRGAFGESGIQPPSGAALQLYAPQAVLFGGAPVTSGGIVNIVNANLQPERTSEFEGGADLGFLHNRVSIGLTAYTRRTTNALVATGVGWEAGGFNAYENIGVVTNNGAEATFSATVLQTRATTWDVSVNASINHNNLVKLAPGLGTQFIYGDHAALRFAPGTPLYGYAAEQEHWTDLNHDGIVELNEVSVDDSLSYVGPSQPTRMASTTTHLGLWRGLLTLGALFDYRGGFRLENTTAFHSATYVQTDLASNDPHAPIWEQLRDVATNYAYTKGLDGYATSAGFYEDASYVRFRELSLTFAAPERWARKVGARTLALTGAVRNVVLWTPYTGGDPEVTSSEGGGTTFQPTTNMLSLNHDVREDAQAVPLSRYFVLRLNVGF